MNRFKISRLTIFQILLVILFLVLIQRVWKLQIIDGKSYADNYELQITKELTEASTRGNIYDRTGELLAGNRQVYTITMTDSISYNSGRERQLTLNGIIYGLLIELEKRGETFTNSLEITVDENGSYCYTAKGTSLLRFLADVFGVSDTKDLTKKQRNISAEDLMEYLTGYKMFALYGEGKTPYTKEERQMYGLKTSYSKEEILQIMGVRYMLSLHAYQKYKPAVIARDISEEMMVYVTENQGNLYGVEIGKEWERIYPAGEPFAHILGYTGDMTVGKAGMEEYLEEELKGMDKISEIMVNNVGKVTGEPVVIQEAISGKDVTLSVDKELQMAVYQMLEQSIAGVVSSNLINAKEFDKSGIRDTTEIRIPVYDVYCALIENSIISLDALKSESATELEQEILGRLKQKKDEVRSAIQIEMTDNNAPYENLTEEMKEYQTFLVLQSGILKEDNLDKKDEVYLSFVKEGRISLKDLLFHGISMGWIDESILKESKEKYTTVEDIYQFILEDVDKRLETDEEFEKLLCMELIRKDSISGREICQLLYEQGIFSKEEEHYKQLLTGVIDAYSFIRLKIENLEITPAQLALDPCSGSAVVVESTTGEVLACVSYPGYDSNRLANQMEGDYYNQLLKDKSLPLYNRATQQLSAPGSTLKPLTVMAGIVEGVIGREETIICDGVFDKITPPLKCWNHGGHGAVVGTGAAITNSCNDFLCEISYRLGTKESGEYNDAKALEYLQKYAALLRLNEKSGIEIAESTPKITDAYAIPSAIGQGTHNYTTVQLAKYVNTIAQKGKYHPLTLQKNIQMDENSENDIQLPKEAFDAAEEGMMQFAENNATLKELGVKAAGKTGTAQESKVRPDHSLFVGYAPADNPQISIAVRIANGYSSSNALYVGKNIFDYYFGLKEIDEIITGKASHASNARND